MRRSDSSPITLKPVFTVTELAEAAKMHRKDGYPDGTKMARWLRSQLVPVRPGRPQTVLLAELNERMPRLVESIRLSESGDSKAA